MVGRAESLQAIRDLLASVTILNATSTQVLARVLHDLVGDQLTPTQMRLLRLVEHQKVLTVGDVATFLGVSNAAASKAVDRLVRGRFLQRIEAKGDRRTMEISVTAAGQRLVDAFEAQSSAALLELLPQPDVRRLRELTDRLDRLSMLLSGVNSSEDDQVCFRCGLYFRDECLLRAMTDRQCYLHLGPTLRSERPRPAKTRRDDLRIGASKGGNG